MISALIVGGGRVCAQTSSGEQFVSPGVVLELRSAASVVGPEIRLKDVLRWNDAGSTICEPLADVVVARFGTGSTSSIALQDIRKVLDGAGVTPGGIRLQGPMQMQVSRIQAVSRQVASPAPVRAEAVVAATERGSANQIEPMVASDATLPQADGAPGPRKTSGGEAPVQPQKARLTLRQLLEQDVARRLSIDPLVLDVQLETADPSVLELSQPDYEFTMVPRLMRRIGPASWRVTVRSGKDSHEYDIRGNVRQWVNQVIATRPMAQRQEISATDVEVRRVLMERAPADPPLTTADGVIGQAAGRNIDVGAPITAKMLQPLLLVRANQVITVVSQFGSVQVRSAMRSVEQGVMGQVIKARNELTRQIIDVEVIGAQTGRVVGSTQGGAGTASASAITTSAAVQPAVAQR